MTDLLLASFVTNALDFFVKGGFFMIFLLALSVVSLTVILLRAAALNERAVLPPGIVAEIERLEPGDDLDNLQKLIASRPSPLGRVVGMLMRHLTWPRAEVAEAVQTQARHEVARLESGLVILEISTGVAPLLGLLGTLSGLVGIFANLGAGGDTVAVARGIAEALNTTIVGLAVAVPSLTAHNYFQRRIEVMAVEMESLVGDLLAKCFPQGAAPTVEIVR
jgi:biopolymer transport protein ExbB